MEYYTRFKEMRQQKGLTHLEAAEGICGKTTIYRFERGGCSTLRPHTPQIVPAPWHKHAGSFHR
ncbi:helix-turn-helix domain-containing protein [Salinicoccus siamensis]|uniref:Helix-turn-helix domain-containing protein n=2 Tax=Salinicoccus siamensis TaxID=381830 RepID=A0ABV5Z4C7_9STAP